MEHGSLLRYISVPSLDRAFNCSVLAFGLRHLEVWFFSESLCDRLLRIYWAGVSGCVGFTTLYAMVKPNLG